MARYREVVLSGSEWTQLGKAKFFFDPNKKTRVVFNEENVRQIGTDTLVTNAREIEVILEGGATKFPTVDPDTNLPLGGDTSYRQLEKILYSLYYQEAQKLDSIQGG